MTRTVDACAPLHVYPVREREHDISGEAECWCAPEVQTGWRTSFRAVRP